MFDDQQLLRDDPLLVELLSHYANRGKVDRAAWQERLMHMEGMEARELSKLHGQLIACDWIEQNTGQSWVCEAGTISACYRITLNGLREWNRFQGVEFDTNLPETSEKTILKFPRKKNPTMDASEALAASE